LIVQLELLLQFEKDQNFTMQETSPDREAELTVLNQLPAIKRLVSKIVGFRTGVIRDENFDMDPGGRCIIQGIFLQIDMGTIRDVSRLLCDGSNIF
jgi:hypothetical protein